VYGYFKCEADSDHPIHSGVKCQEHTADACGVGLGTFQCTVNKENLILMQEEAQILSCLEKIGIKKIDCYGLF
jgi:hypothetical protein